MSDGESVHRSRSIRPWNEKYIVVASREKANMADETFVQGRKQMALDVVEDLFIYTREKANGRPGVTFWNGGDDAALYTFDQFQSKTDRV